VNPRAVAARPGSARRARGRTRAWGPGSRTAGLAMVIEVIEATQSVQARRDKSVQKHIDERIGDGWTLVDHSVAIAVDPVSNATTVVYSFIWQREAMDQ
jgi:hypothetical protein